MRAEKHRIDTPPGQLQLLEHVRMNGIDRCHVDHAAADAGLVGCHHHMPAGMVQPRHRLERASDGRPFLGRLDMVIPEIVEDAVTAQDHEFDNRLHARPRSGSQPRQVGNTVHRRVQIAQQRQAVGAQRSVFGVDHHRFEKCVDRRFQSCQGLQ